VKVSVLAGYTEDVLHSLKEHSSWLLSQKIPFYAHYCSSHKQESEIKILKITIDELRAEIVSLKAVNNHGPSGLSTDPEISGDSANICWSYQEGCQC